LMIEHTRQALKPRKSFGIVSKDIFHRLEDWNWIESRIFVYTTQTKTLNHSKRCETVERSEKSFYRSKQIIKKISVKKKRNCHGI
jgi:hypothetical protein